MKMLKKIFAFVLLFSIVFSSIGISTYAKESSALTEVVDSSVTSPEEDGKRVFTLKGADLEDNDIKVKVRQNVQQMSKTQLLFLKTLRKVQVER